MSIGSSIPTGSDSGSYILGNIVMFSGSSDLSWSW